MNSLQHCTLCPRRCKINGEEEAGRRFCLGFGNKDKAANTGEVLNQGTGESCGNDIRVARAALHMWEEPCISGNQEGLSEGFSSSLSAERGSGTVFFSGCTLKCVYCQNYEISHKCHGKDITVERLGEIFDELYQNGAYNINLVSAAHYARQIYKLFDSGYKKKIPIVYNTSGYESIETLRMLNDIVDIYLPDVKYYGSDVSQRYSGVSDYFPVSLNALKEMFSQRGNIKLNSDGIADSGVLIRHLVLPGCSADSVRIVDELEMHFSNETYLSLMSQYIPAGRAFEYKEINRRVTTYEYNKVCEHAINRGFKNVYVQKRESANRNYIPLFDLSGV